MKKIYIAIGILVAAIIFLAAAYFLMMKITLSKMKPLETGQITSEVYAIKDSYVNCFLVRYDSSYIMIDAGNNEKNILKGLEKLRIDPADVKAIFLTHSDADHVASIPLFHNARIYLSEQEEQLIDGKTSRVFLSGNKLHTESYTLLKDGQEIRLPGLTIRCILTPGHTTGSMSYLVNGKDLFTGDVIRLKKGKAQEFHHFINMDTASDMESVKKLSRMHGVQYVFTAHYGMTSDFDGAFREWK